MRRYYSNQGNRNSTVEEDRSTALIKTINQGVWWLSVGIWIATGVFLWMNILVPVLCIGLLFFGWLEYLRAQNFPSNYFLGGPANWVTWIRFLCISALIFLAGTSNLWLLALLCSLEVGLDVLDGWLARRYGCLNETGVYFDKEMDAFYVMVVVLLIYYQGVTGPWILGLGLIRFFMPFIKPFLKEPAQKDLRTNYGKFIAGIVMGGLAVAWVLPSELRLVVYFTLAILLSYSFGKEILDRKWSTS